MTGPGADAATDVAADVTALQSALGARERLRNWAAGAELLALLRVAGETGWLDALAAGTTPDALAALGGVSARRAGHVLDVLVSEGVAAPAGDTSFRLTPEFAALHAGASGVTLPVVLDALEADRDRVRHALTARSDRPAADDALVVARNWGVLPTAATRVLFGLVYDAVPRYRDRLRDGGRLLDVGSGLGGALLTTLTLFPGLRAVGVEYADDVVAELTDRARAAGVVDRLRVRHLRAEDLDDEDAFDACYWAQAFFAPGSRAPVLAAIRRALVPGGLLFVQELAPPPGDDPPARTRAGLDALVADTRGGTPVRPAEDLAEELTAAGFAGVGIVASPVGRLVLAHSP